MSVRNRRHRPIVIQSAAVCVGLALLFGLYSPVRLGTQVRTAIDTVTKRLIEASLFFELNPFLYTETVSVSADSRTPAEEKPASVEVIDTTPSAETTGSRSNAVRADTVSRGIYADVASDEATAEVVPPAVEVTYRNETSYTPDTASLLAADNAFALSEQDVQILIVHTHTSESYTPDETYHYTPDDNNRTLDTAYNVVRVGDVLEQRLTEAGFSVIHDETVHDYPSYTGSYSRSLDTVLSALADAPGIDIVIDLHRDAMIGDDGTVYGTSVSVEKNGQSLDSAQLMLVIGTNEGGLSHPDWEENLSFAVKLQTTLESMYPSLMRPVNLRRERFNQHVTPASILLEVGSSGDTLGEALTAAELFADGLIELLGTYIV